MAITAKPEILSPRTSAPQGVSGDKNSDLFKDANLDLLSHLLDDFIRIPGTPIRFGLDGIAGFIPGVGDILGGLASSIIIIAACMRGVPRVTVARMVLNVAIETGVGSLPLVGDMFDIWFRANRRNYALMTASIAAPHTPRARTADWLFLLLTSLALLGLMLLPLVLLGWLLVHLKAWFTAPAH